MDPAVKLLMDRYNFSQAAAEAYLAKEKARAAFGQQLGQENVERTGGVTAAAQAAQGRWMKDIIPAPLQPPDPMTVGNPYVRAGLQGVYNSIDSMNPAVMEDYARRKAYDSNVGVRQADVARSARLPQEEHATQIRDRAAENRDDFPSLARLYMASLRYGDQSRGK